ncbi:MAG: hypothetical protein AB4290_12105 [Spirulina sp.]
MSEVSAIAPDLVTSLTLPEKRDRLICRLPSIKILHEFTPNYPSRSPDPAMKFTHSILPRSRRQPSRNGMIKVSNISPKTMLKLQLLPGALFELFASAVDTGTLTLSDRYGLMATLLDEQLTEEEEQIVNRLLYAVRRGNIKLAKA